MKIYAYEIKELLSKTIRIEAETEMEAYKKVKEMYHKEEIVLDSFDFKEMEINNFEENERD